MDEIFKNIHIRDLNIQKYDKKWVESIKEQVFEQYCCKSDLSDVYKRRDYMFLAIEPFDKEKLRTACFIGDIPVGCISYIIEHNVYDNYIEILNLGSILKGRNVGTALIYRVITKARELHLQKIIVNSLHSAEGFYEKCGFIECEESKRYSSNCMVKHLDIEHD